MDRAKVKMSSGNGDNDHWAFGWRTRVPPRAQCIPVHPVDGGCLAYDSSRSRTFMLSETAQNVWRHCDGRRSLDELALIQTAAFDVDYDTALDHVEQLVVKFSESGLLTS